eukprot:gene5449-2440_t
MSKLIILTIVAISALAVLANAKQGFGSYKAVCNGTDVTFENYKASGCTGPSTVMSKPLGGCRTEPGIKPGSVWSWNAKCGIMCKNATAPNPLFRPTIQYYNYENPTCAGAPGSLYITRTYFINECFECANAECKTAVKYTC